MKNSTKIKYNALFLATLNVVLGIVCLSISTAAIAAPLLFTQSEIAAFCVKVLGV